MKGACVADLSAITISLTTTPPSKTCLRCDKPRDAEEHVCEDLRKNDNYNPLRMEIDLTNISLRLEDCHRMDHIFEEISRLVEPKIQTKIESFRTRIRLCRDGLLKLYSLHAPYRLNEWDAAISQLEDTCKAYEKRIVGN